MWMRKGIVLIGPICAGKSTLAGLLADKLGMPRVEMDELRWKYFEGTGYSKDEARQIYHAEGNLGVLRYSKQFEAEMVEKMLAHHPKAVIDFGAGHSIYDNAADLERVSRALKPFNVVLVLPFEDEDKSIAVLNTRFKALLEREKLDPSQEMMDMNTGFVRHPANRQLANIVLYTEDKTAKESCTELLVLLEE